MVKAAKVVLPVPPLPTTANVVVMMAPCFWRWTNAEPATTWATEGKLSRSVCGRKSADVKASMKLLSALSSR